MEKNLYTRHTEDYETGELKTVEWIRRKKLTQDQFIVAYIEDIGALAKCSGSEQSTVLCCLKYVVWETNEIVLNGQRRKEICECGNLKLNTVNCAISRLQAKNIFIKNEGRLYLNPKLFFFGPELSRVKMFELKIQYEICKNC